MHVDVFANDPALSPSAALATARQRGAKRVIFHGGEYFNVDLRLAAADSGMILEAAAGESPVLHGGRRLDGWCPDGDRFWAAPAPGVRDGTWDFRTLIVQGRLAPHARLPHTGMFTHESTFDGRWMSSTAGGWDRKPTEFELTTLRYSPGDLGPWLDSRNAECTVYHQWDESLAGIRAHDPAARTLTFATPCTHPPGSFGWNRRARCFVVWNVREGMSQPGQWYLDRTRGLVVYWPLPDEEMSQVAVIAPAGFHVIRCDGAPGRPIHGVVIRGLTLAATTTPLRSAGFGAGNLDGAITIKGPAEDIAIEQVQLRHAGGQGIHFSGDCRRVRIGHCVIEDCGGPGIFGRGEECAVSDTTVHRIGRVYPSAVALSLMGKRCVIRHNDVGGCPYTAIQSGGEEIRIEYNVLRDFMQELDDGAAIYSFAAKRCVYRGNAAYGASGRLAHAYYLDEQSEDCVVEDNLAVNTRSPAHNHMAAHCIIRRNVFIDDGSSTVSIMRSRDFIFENNLWAAGGEMTIRTTRDGLKAITGNVFHPGQGALRIAWLKEDGYTVDVVEDSTPDATNTVLGPRPPTLTPAPAQICSREYNGKETTRSDTA